ncbi:hypothetical protein [Microcoleus asticus]|uniref:hypothetical protein n=1 Tax=Microcoleus asticus TaxID=2815231 RepID=UPI0015565724|nr:hypothetical protein [Microcoleus asticus]
MKGLNPPPKAQVYTYSQTNLRAMAHHSNFGVSASFQATYLANSITLVAIPKA